MSGTPKIPLAKPWCSYSDQVLPQRGLAVSVPQAAEQFLPQPKYYRLSAKPSNLSAATQRREVPHRVHGSRVSLRPSPLSRFNHPVGPMVSRQSVAPGLES
jgi:hypothetical protein